MITSTKNYTKRNKKTNRQNPRTNGKNKAIQTKSHTEAHTYTLTKREKWKKIYISLLPNPRPQFGMIHFLCRYSTGAVYIKLNVEI